MRFFSTSSCMPRLLLALVAALPLAAAAHTGVEAHAAHAHPAFLAGFLHPLSGLDHLAAMVSIGLWSALAARRAGPTLLAGPLGFVALLLAGAVLGLLGVQLPAVEPMIAASLLVSGLLVITRWRLSGGAAALLAGGFALFHGLAHGQELAGNVNAAFALAGMLSATVLLHASGLGLGWILRRAPLWLPRAAGAGVALFGMTLLAGLA